MNFDVLKNLSTQDMVNTFQTMSNKLLCETFPEKQIIIREDDQPWYNEQLRKLKHLRLREYDLHGQSEKYLKIKTLIEEKY